MSANKPMTFFDLWSGAEEDEPAAETVFTPAQARQVYRFKAALWHRKGLWRRIEIQGGDTLADFDHILRDAFQHDPMDHLGGFWKLVPRGTSKRVREVELGDIYPFGGKGSGEGRHIAGLGLKPGDELKYVYDFGDWIEHRLTLEEVVEPEAGAEYRRVVGQNAPKYAYCIVCQAKGQKTVAPWICLTCSTGPDDEVLLCEKHVSPKHEDHYVGEMLY